MNKNISFLSALPFILAFGIVLLMTAAAELLDEREILFPEIAAIAAGAFICPTLKWNTNSLRLFLTIAAGSVSGLAIVLFVPLPLWAQLCAAFLCGLIILKLSRTTFAPLISSVVLPVMLQTRSVIYPISAMILTAAVILLRKVCVHLGALKDSAFTPEPAADSGTVKELLLMWVLGSTVIIIAALSGFKLAAAPPLLVAFTEFWKKGSAAEKRPISVIGMVSGCALIGTLAKGAAIYFGFYAFLAAGAAAMTVYLAMKKTGLIIPPAAALCVLAFLIDEQQLLLYPLLILAGSTAFVMICRLHFIISDPISPQ